MYSQWSEYQGRGTEGLAMIATLQMLPEPVRNACTIQSGWSIWNSWQFENLLGTFIMFGKSSDVRT